MKINRIIVIGVTILMLLSTGCSRTGIPSCSGEINLTHPYIKYLGRCVFENGKVVIDNSCAGFEINMKGTAVTVRLKELSSSEYTTCYAVIVNGKRTETIELIPGEQEYKILDKAVPGDYTVKLVKITEERFTQSDLTGITVLGKLTSRPADKTRKIEFVGDSLTAGFGILSTNASDQYSPLQQDSSQTYSVVASEELDADYNIIAVSGWGIGVDCNGDKMGVLPAVYGFSHYFRDYAVWDFSQFQPDLVVINLGTNDFSAKIDNEALEQAIKDFTAVIANKNPNAKILWCYGFATDNRISDLEKAVLEIADSNKNVSFIKIPTMDIAVDGVGALYHPSLKSHKKAGIFLAEKIRYIMDW